MAEFKPDEKELIEALKKVKGGFKLDDMLIGAIRALKSDYTCEFNQLYVRNTPSLKLNPSNNISAYVPPCYLKFRRKFHLRHTQSVAQVHQLWADSVFLGLHGRSL